MTATVVEREPKCMKHCPKIWHNSSCNEMSEKTTKRSLVIASIIGQKQLSFLHGKFAKKQSFSLLHQHAGHSRFNCW